MIRYRDSHVPTPAYGDAAALAAPSDGAAVAVAAGSCSPTGRRRLGPHDHDEDDEQQEAEQEAADAVVRSPPVRATGSAHRRIVPLGTRARGYGLRDFSRGDPPLRLALSQHDLRSARSSFSAWSSEIPAMTASRSTLRQR